jgi:biotin carboxylase
MQAERSQLVMGVPASERATFRPVVAVGYGPRCVPVMQVVEAAAGLCDLVWLVDGGLPEMVQMHELLSRFGPVVDISGPDPVDAVAASHPDGLVTLLDAGMVQLAQVAERIGLPFHTAATAGALTDKALQRDVLRQAGLPGPGCYVVPPGDASEAVQAVGDHLSWPAILKPRSAQGSRYTFLAAGPAEAVRLLDALGPDRREMVLEDYLVGDPGRTSLPYADYVSVESLVAGGVVSHVAVTGRFPLAENFRETGFFIPAALQPGEQGAVLDLATMAIKALGVTVGCLHTEIKFTPVGPRLIEVNGRVGGGVPEMIDRAAGVPLLEWMLRVALAEPLHIDGPVECQRVGYRFFLQPPAMSATVRAIDGLDIVSDHPGVDAVSVHQGPGAALDWRDGTRTHIIAVVGSARDYEELLAVDQLLHREVSVTYSEARV